MAESFQITRIKKPGGSDNPHTRITEVYVTLPPLALPFPSASNYNLARFMNSVPRGEWRTVETVIADIEAGKQYYYTDTKGKRAEVMVYSRQLQQLPAPFTSFPGQYGAFGPMTAAYQRKYIKTRSDATTVDNLLSLPNDYDK